MRSIVWSVAVLTLLAVTGCGGSDLGGKVSGGKTSAATARAELIATAKKMEGGSWTLVESFVKSVEGGLWSWKIADEEFAPGKFTPETINAYHKWRTARLAEDQVKKK